MNLLDQALQLDGYAILGAQAMRDQLGRLEGEFDSQWDAFCASWNRLAPDPYLAQVGLNRRRRHAVGELTMADGVLRFGPHQPHYQSRVYNALQGGIERWFEPIEADIKSNACLQALIRFAATHFTWLKPEVPQWLIEVHQFRIEATALQSGQPTPEGTHRDGVDYVLVSLMERNNIRSGTTSVHALDDGHELAHFTLTRPLDTVLIDDRRLAHGVTPVEPDDASQPAWRDVLVITLRAAASPTNPTAS